MFGHDAREDIARVCRVLARLDDRSVGPLELAGPEKRRADGDAALRPRLPAPPNRCRRRAGDRSLGPHRGRIAGAAAQFEADVEFTAADTMPVRCFLQALRTRWLQESRVTDLRRSRIWNLQRHTIWSSGKQTRWRKHQPLRWSSQLILKSTAVHQPGIGIWASGKEQLDCLTVLYHLEYLAQANLIRAQWKDGSDTVLRADSDKLWSQFPATVITPSFSLRSIPACTRIPITVFSALTIEPGTFMQS